MAKRSASIRSINRRLERAVHALSTVAADIRDAALNSKTNVRKVGQALSCIFQIQHDVYRREPELLPKILYGTKIGDEVLSNRAVKKGARRKQPRASYRKR